MSSLAEIVEEGKSAEETYRNARAWTAAEIGAADACHRFYLAHGPRLLAVAEAAVEMRSHAHIQTDEDGILVAFLDSGFEDGLAAFDAAAGGQP